MGFGIRNPFTQFQVTDPRGAAQELMGQAGQTAAAMMKKGPEAPKKTIGGALMAGLGGMAGGAAAGPAGMGVGAAGGIAAYYLS